MDLLLSCLEEFGQPPGRRVGATTRGQVDEDDASDGWGRAESWK
jgi:hypothetical protein